jgi:hypothetical protein
MTELGALVGVYLSRPSVHTLRLEISDRWRGAVADTPTAAAQIAGSGATGTAFVLVVLCCSPTTTRLCGCEVALAEGQGADGYSGDSTMASTAALVQLGSLAGAGAR